MEDKIVRFTKDSDRYYDYGDRTTQVGKWCDHPRGGHCASGAYNVVAVSAEGFADSGKPLYFSPDRRTC